jgi:hypothetical protein
MLAAVTSEIAVAFRKSKIEGKGLNDEKASSSLLGMHACGALKRRICAGTPR